MTLAVRNTDAGEAVADKIETSTGASDLAATPTYIYGHACHYHACSFTRLRDESETRSR